MPLAKQVISFPLGSFGMDSGKDPKLSDGVLVMENCQFKRKDTISKRFGTAQVASNIAVNQSDVRVASYSNRPVIITPHINQLVADNYYKAITGIQPFKVEREALGISTTNSWYACEYASLGNVMAVIYATKDPNYPLAPYGLIIETFDVTTGVRLATKELIAADDQLQYGRVLNIADDYLRYYYFDGADLKYGTINTTTGAISTTTTLSELRDRSSTKVEWDACVVENLDDPPYVHIVYIDNQDKVTWLTMENGESAIVNTEQWQITSAVVNLGIFYQTHAHATLVWAEDNLTNIIIYAVTRGNLNSPMIDYVQVDTFARTSYDSLILSGVANTDISATIYIGKKHKIYTSYGNFPFIDTCNYWGDEEGHGNASAVTMFLPQCQIAHKPIYYATNKHFLGVYSAGYEESPIVQSFYAWVDETASLVCKAEFGLARNDSTIKFIPNANPVNVASYPYSWAVSVPRLIRRVSAGDTGFYDLFLLDKLKISTEHNNGTIQEVDGSLLISGGFPIECDGVQTFEQGFLKYPSPIYAVAGTSGGMALGTYHYVFLYEWIDAKGKVHRSAPTPSALSITLGGAEDSVTLYVPTLPLTLRSNVRIVCFRTLVNGAVFYRVGYLSNDKTKVWDTFTDDNADSEIDSNDILYTEGNVFENVPPVTHSISCIHQNRIITVDDDNPSTHVYYSKRVYEQDAVSFSDLLTFTVNRDGGAITAITSLLDKLILFKNERIYASNGDGYNDNGSGQNFSEPFLISPTIGCVNKKSIARVPEGVMFMARDRIWLLSQNLQLAPIGDKVKYFTDNFTIRSSVIDYANHCAEWITNGPDLVYDYLYDKWSVANYCYNAVTGYKRFYDAINSGNAIYRYYYDSGNAYFYKDNAHFYDDSTIHVGLKVKTGWLSPFGLGEWGHIYQVLLIMQNIGTNTIRVKIGYDHDPNWTDNLTFSSSSLTAFADSEYFGDGLSSSYADQAYLIKVNPSRGKISSIRLEISDEQYGLTPSEQISISGLSLLVAKADGLKRLGAHRSM